MSGEIKKVPNSQIQKPTAMQSSEKKVGKFGMTVQNKVASTIDSLLTVLRCWMK